MDRRRKHDRKKSENLASIGELPPVEHSVRRRACSENLGHFLQVYFPEKTGRSPFSLDHYSVIDIIETCIRTGGWYANAVFREFAKTSIAERAVLWAVLGGYRKNCPIIGADDGAASEVIEAIEWELCNNEMLLADYPEACIAFRHLGGRHQRCASQSYPAMGSCLACGGGGVVEARGGGIDDCKECGGSGSGRTATLTKINCVGGELVFPTIRLTAEESRDLGIPVDAGGWTLCSGAAINAHGILSYKRGSKIALPDGSSARPSFAIIDDFQTDMSAMSATETRKRVKKIAKAIIPSAGQRSSMALVINGTVIEPGDGMEHLLDPVKSPGFNGRRIPILKRRATEAAEKLWFGEYATLLQSYDRNAANPQSEQDRARGDATAFYAAHREAMDDGAAATWESARLSWELSAIQHCYNIWIEQGEEVFLCEGQQQPKIPEADVRRLTLEQISEKAAGPSLPRGVVPAWSTRLVAYIDVQDSCLYWLVLAVTEGYTSHVVDYGVHPQQSTGSLELQRIKAGLHTLRHQYEGMGAEGALRRGIDDLSLALFGHRYSREDGREQRLDWAAIDSADGSNSSVVYEAVRRSQYAATFRAARGWKFGAADPTWEEFAAKYKRPTEEFYWHCWETPIDAGIRLFKMDSNHWKTFAFKRLSASPGEVGSLSLFGSPGDHEQFARQLLGPKSIVLKNEKGREVEEWKTQPGVDDHLFDCLYGAFAVAARVGVVIPSMPGAVRAGRQERRVFTLPSRSGG